jgi:hypothetical protein
MQKRSVGTIVEEDKNSRQQGRRNDAKAKGDPVRVPLADGQGHQREQEQVSCESGQELPKGFTDIALEIVCGGLVPPRFFPFGHYYDGIERHTEPHRSCIVGLSG